MQTEVYVLNKKDENQDKKIKSKGCSKMTVYTAHCDRAFVVDSSKAKDFLRQGMSEKKKLDDNKNLSKISAKIKIKK